MPWPIAKPFTALWRLFAFETPVHLDSRETSAELVRRLNRLIAPPRAFGKLDRRKALRGRISESGGFVRWPLNEYRFVSPRSIQFQLIQNSEGTVLSGSFKVWKGFRVAILGWLYCAAILEFIFSTLSWWHTHSLKMLGTALAGILFAFCMAYAYAWIAVRVGRARDRQLVKVLAHTIADPISAETIRDLLTD
jgi:hypothetical protein